MSSLSHTLRVIEQIDSPRASGARIAAMFAPYADHCDIKVTTITGPKGKTDFVRVTVAGSRGKRAGGAAPTLGVVGRLGGIGARPSRIGMVSDADGATAALAAALQLAHMHAEGDVLAGDVILGTHICPDAPTRPHHPVDFMDSPMDMETLNEQEIAPEMDAVLSIDTTKGNRVINHKGIAISPTVKEGYILRVSEDLLRIQEMTTGLPAVTFPITMQDITPYGNGVHHLNSILQPSVATSAPVVGVAITAMSVVPGCGTGASHEVDIASAARFTVEVAKEFTQGTCHFHDAGEYQLLLSQYGSMAHLQGRSRA